MVLTLKLWLLIAGMAISVSCSKPTVTAPGFDGERAFTYLVGQVAFGPRVPGGEASAACRRYLYDHFDALGLTVDSQAFAYFDPYSRQELRLVNVIAAYRGQKTESTDRILLMAHYDSRPRAEHATDTALRGQPIDGANDGASGVAVLMELANMVAETPPPCEIDIVLVDGEDWGKEGDLANYMLGSKEFARQGIRGKYRFGILLDMVGDRSLGIYRESMSQYYAKEINDMVFKIAADLNITTFIDSVKHAINDDHLSINAAGVPMIDIIDFDYPYWHTEFDTPDKCSPQSLADVGRVVAHILYGPSLWPKK